MAEIIQQPAGEQPDRNWASTRAGTALAAGIVAVEAVPPFNEIIRFGTLAWAMKAGLDPVVASSLAGGAGWALESCAAIATADALATEKGMAVVGRLNERLDKLGASKYLHTNLATEVGIASIGGSAIVTVAKHRQEPERTRQQNRKYGLTSAAGIGMLTFGESYLAATGIEHPNPVTIGLGAAAVGALVGGYKWTKNRLSQQEETIHQRVNRGESPQLLGLSEEDQQRVMEDERTEFIEDNGEKVPFLVPIDTLYWYNHDYLRQRFGTDDIFYYAHPELSDEKSYGEAYERIASFVEDGGVVLYDTVTAGNRVFGDLDHEMEQSGKELQRVPLTKEGRQRFLLQYDGTMIVKGKDAKHFKEATPVFETYQAAIERGDLTVDAENGPALKEVIDGDEAERLWNIYQKPFEKLSDSHPINSGYDKEEFLKILKSPEMVKAIYRDKGEITTLALFVNDLEHCSWLDADYYKNKYPEAIATGNHFVFPGIVTDELKRGASYSLPLLQMIAKVQAMRKTPAIISFECTDTSYKYIPRIVRFAIGRTGVAKTEGFKKPVSRFDYYALTK